jgi:hypothetical protein
VTVLSKLMRPARLLAPCILKWHLRVLENLCTPAVQHGECNALVSQLNARPELGLSNNVLHINDHLKV